jgi:hypothetical protein
MTFGATRAGNGAGVVDQLFDVTAGEGLVPDSGFEWLDHPSRYPAPIATATILTVYAAKR